MQACNAVRGEISKGADWGGSHTHVRVPGLSALVTVTVKLREVPSSSCRQTQRQKCHPFAACYGAAADWAARARCGRIWADEVTRSSGARIRGALALHSTCERVRLSRMRAWSPSSPSSVGPNSAACRGTGETQDIREASPKYTHGFGCPHHAHVQSRPHRQRGYQEQTINS